jgi:uncharacterized membrane protein
MSDNPMFLYAGEYESVEEAKADLEELKELHHEHLVGIYDAAVLTKNEEGKVEIVDKNEKPTQRGGWAGLAVGAAIGLIFPPSVLVSDLVGAGAPSSGTSGAACFARTSRRSARCSRRARQP